MQSSETNIPVDLVETPAFILDLRAVQETAAQYRRIGTETGVKVLYATKPLLHRETLELLAGTLDGLTASSFFSAELCRAVLGNRPTLSIVTPAYREGEIEQIAALCDQMVFNSLTQWQRWGKTLAAMTSVGLRVNPGLSFVPDARYDPGRPGGKLGIPLSQLAQVSLSELKGVAGLHFHSNCESPNYEPLWKTVQHLTNNLNGLLQHVEWINIGGGYHLPHSDEWGGLYKAIGLLRERYPQATIYMEPGAPLVRPAGTLIASVVDIFESEDKTVAVLDTTVNHLPEVFEYQYAPEVVGHAEHHPFTYVLAGATCLAGDVFGSYSFLKPLTIGDKVTFPNVGAYSLAKAHWFNGIALPTLYTRDVAGKLHLRRRFMGNDYARQLGWQSEERF